MLKGQKCHKTSLSGGRERERKRIRERRQREREEEEGELYFITAMNNYIDYHEGFPALRLISKIYRSKSLFHPKITIEY